MKVTVCFGTVRVVVPCGCNGELTVCKLINEAVSRYKKATNKPADYQVTVHNLRSSSDFAILDEDDLISDVADDKDQIIAEFDEIPPCDDDSIRMMSQSHNGDVMFPFVTGNNNNNNNSKNIIIGVDISRDLLYEAVVSDKIVSVEHKSIIAPECIDTQNDDASEVHVSQKVAVDHHIIPVPCCNALPSSSASEHSRFGSSEPNSPSFATDDDLNSSTMSNVFVRDSSRKSLGNGLSMNKWFVAQEKLTDQYEGNVRNSCVSVTSSISACTEDMGEAVVITPPVMNPSLHSPVINKVDDELGGNTSSVTSCLSPPQRPPRHKHTPANYNVINLHINDVTVAKPSEFLASNSSNLGSNANSMVGPVTKSQQTDSVSSGSLSVQQASCVLTKQPVSATLSSLKSGVLAPTNTRRIGNKFAIDLIKGPNGLGFSITSRDNLAGGNCPIYIKNVLPQGAAIEDGRLKPGDRLLEVNGVKITGLGQSEAAALLRSITPNSLVNLMISRQITEDTSDIVPASETLTQQDNTIGLSESTSSSSMPNNTVHDVEAENSRLVKGDTDAVLRDSRSTVNHLDPTVDTEHEKLTFNIALGETGFASLGISVKKLTVGRKDLGIFIKSVLIGGTAAKDGRLQVNDQLVQVNGVTLFGLDNAQALQILREAMQKDGRLKGFIGISVARPKNVQVNPQPVTGLHEVRVSQLEQNEIDDSVCVLHQNDENSVGDSTISKECQPDAVGEIVSVKRNKFSGQQQLPENKKSAYAEESLSMSEAVKPPEVPSRRIKDIPSPIIADTDSLMETDSNCDAVRDETSPDDPESTPGFLREGFGRQSMSEKRKGHIDPKNLDVYQKIKVGKDKTPHIYASWDPRKSLFHRSAGNSPLTADGSTSDAMVYGSVDGLTGRVTVNPLHECRNLSKSKDAKCEVNLKKYKSLEDLQPELPLPQTSQPDQACSVAPQTGTSSVVRPSTAGISRICGGNESFRAAVDRSYDGNDSELMETVEEDTAENETVHRHAVITTPKSAKLEGHIEPNRTWGLFKGIAGIFRLVKPKKNDENRKDKTCDNSSSEILSSSGTQEIVREVSKTSKFYVPEEFANGRNLKQEPPAVPGRVVNNSLMSSYDVKDEASSDSTRSKLQRMHELRRQHQRSHRERSGHYPLEEKEDQYELQIREYEKQLKRTAPTLVSHSRSRSSPVAQPTERQMCWPESSYSSAFVQQSTESDRTITAQVSATTAMGFSSPQSSAEFHVYRSTPQPVYHPAERDSTAAYYSLSRGNKGRTHASEHRSAFSSYNRTDGLTSGNHISLPSRNHAMHVPIGFIAADQLTSPGYLHSQSVTRRSYRESTTTNTEGASASGIFQRFVSLPPRQRRNRREFIQNRYEVALAHSAQV